MLVLPRIFPEGIRIPELFLGTNVVHLPTVKCHIYTTTTGAMKNAFGGLLATRRHYTHTFIHETLVDLLTIQKEIHTGLFAVMDGTTAGVGPGAAHHGAGAQGRDARGGRPGRHRRRGGEADGLRPDVDPLPAAGPRPRPRGRRPARHRGRRAAGDRGRELGLLGRRQPRQPGRRPALVRPLQGAAEAALPHAAGVPVRGRLVPLPRLPVVPGLRQEAGLASSCAPRRGAPCSRATWPGRRPPGSMAAAEPVPGPAPTAWRWRAGVVALFVAALGVRLLGIDWDQGAMFHPDERRIAEAVLEMSFSPLQLDPHFFAYGSLPLVLTRAACSLGGLLSPWFLTFGGVVLTGRALSALWGALTVVLAASLGRRLGGERAGLLAGGLLAMAVLHVQNSHFATVDVPLACLATAALLLAVRVLDGGGPGRLALAGLVVGFALATKVSAAPLLLPLGLAPLLRWGQERRWARAVAWAALAGVERGGRLPPRRAVRAAVLACLPPRGRRAGRHGAPRRLGAVHDAVRRHDPRRVRARAAGAVGARPTARAGRARRRRRGRGAGPPRRPGRVAAARLRGSAVRGDRVVSGALPALPAAAVPVTRRVGRGVARRPGVAREGRPRRPGRRPRRHCALPRGLLSHLHEGAHRRGGVALVCGPCARAGLGAVPALGRGVPAPVPRPATGGVGPPVPVLRRRHPREGRLPHRGAGPPGLDRPADEAALRGRAPGARALPVHRQLLPGAVRRRPGVRAGVRGDVAAGPGGASSCRTSWPTSRSPSTTTPRCSSSQGARGSMRETLEARIRGGLPSRPLSLPDVLRAGPGRTPAGARAAA